MYNTVAGLKLIPFRWRFWQYKGKSPELISTADTVCMHIEYLNLPTGKCITVSMELLYLINQKTGSYNKEIYYSVSKKTAASIMDNCGSQQDALPLKTGLPEGTPWWGEYLTIRAPQGSRCV